MSLKKIDPLFHSILDYVLVLFFWLSPSIFNFNGTVALILYLGGLLHFLITIFTISPLGLFKVISFKTHGHIEVCVSLLFLVFPWILGFSEDLKARNFCLAIGGSLFVIWLLSTYRYKTEKT